MISAIEIFLTFFACATFALALYCLPKRQINDSIILGTCSAVAMVLILYVRAA